MGWPKMLELILALTIDGRQEPSSIIFEERQLEFGIEAIRAQVMVGQELKLCFGTSHHMAKSSEWIVLWAL
jgi:hypothetical protein